MKVDLHVSDIFTIVLDDDPALLDDFLYEVPDEVVSRYKKLKEEWNEMQSLLEEYKSYGRGYDGDAD
jgi:hypothetical protein